MHRVVGMSPGSVHSCPSKEEAPRALHLRFGDDREIDLVGLAAGSVPAANGSRGRKSCPYTSGKPTVSAPPGGVQGPSSRPLNR